MKLSDRQWAFLKDFAKLIIYMDEVLEWKVTGGELERSVEQQRIHVAEGRSWTMDSDHIIKMAIDLFIFINGGLTWDSAKIEPAAVYWESLSEYNYWGGRWKGKKKDVPHFGRSQEKQREFTETIPKSEV